MIWKKINEITNRNKKSTNNNDSKDKIDCTKFNHLFCNIGQSLASSFGDRINYNDIDNTIFNRMESIYLYPVDNDEVIKTVLSCKSKTSKDANNTFNNFN